MDAVASAALYRLVQEGLTNAHKHGAGTATVRFHVDSGVLRAVIANPVRQNREPAQDTGFGLIGMRERMESAGGRLTISEEPGRFTVIGDLPTTEAEDAVERTNDGI
ncbi:sensor histidine kinase [Leifsonia xyli]|uniref:sensor histidine kinase n=1 Tax=Leifsonia xyli TaxID=1575 RepID=UPI003D6770C4